MTSVSTLRENMLSDSVIAKYNQAELSSAGDVDSKQCLVTRALDRATGLTRLKRRV